MRSSPPTFIFLIAFTLVQALLLALGFMHYGKHPDELGGRIMDLIPWTKWLSYNYYYPTTHVYTLKLLTVPIADILHFKLKWVATYDDLLFNRLGRILTGLFALAMPWLVFWLGRLSGWKSNIALTTAALTGTFPLIFNLAHYNTTDIPNLFWIFLSIGLAFRGFSKLSFASIGVAGITLGFAAGVKYLAVLCAPGIVLGLFVSSYQHRPSWKFALTNTNLFALCLLLGFVISTPAVVFDTAKFLTDLAFLQRAVPVWAGVKQPIGALGIPAQIAQTMNPIVLLLAILGLVRMIKHWRDPHSITILFGVTTFYLFMARNHFYPQRFLLPIYGLLLISNGEGLRFVAGVKIPPKVHHLRVLWLIPIAAIALQLKSVGAIAYNHLQESRYLAAQWIIANANSQSRLVLPKTIDTYFPVAFLQDELLLDSELLRPEGDVIIVPCEVAYGMSSSFFGYQPGWVQSQLEEQYKVNWELVQTFEMLSFLGSKPDFTEFLSPTIKIYRRKDPCLIK